MGIWESLLLALGLCADSFAVSLCSSIRMKKAGMGRLLMTALCFAVIHTGFLSAGWGLGELLTGVVGKAAGIVAFLLLLYVGGTLLYEGIADKVEGRSLGSFRDVLICGVATSLDAAAAGAAQSIAGMTLPVFMQLFAILFAVTVLSVLLGILYGSSLGRRYGKAAEITGGLVLLFIAFWNLFR